jgi:fructokinase
VSAGEALIDFTPREVEGKLTGFDLHPGGSPYNVAIGVARLGSRAAFVGDLSSDLFGTVLENHLKASGVETRWVWRVAAPTPLAFVAPAEDEGNYTFRLEGTSLFNNLPRELPGIRPIGILHFGSVALARSESATALLVLARAWKGQALLSFDPNVRPMLVDDWSAYQHRVRQAWAIADVVKVSEMDLESLREISTQPAPDSGPRAVVVTRGARGSRLELVGGAVATFPAVPCLVRDTIGAGDAFTAGMLVSLAERGVVTAGRLLALDLEAWESIVRVASTAAALACEGAGAAMPTLAEVKEAIRSRS